jgi:hypothetical protein
VKKRHSQMTNTAKQQHSSDIYDNNKPGKWTKVEDKPSHRARITFLTRTRPPARSTVQEILLKIKEWLHTLHTSVRGWCVWHVFTFSTVGDQLGMPGQNKCLGFIMWLTLSNHVVCQEMWYCPFTRR